MEGKVAIVTGANKGIGLSIVRGLCEQLRNTDVYLTARNESLGLQAVKFLNKEGLFPKFHQLDITNISSIEVFKDYIQKTHGGIDVLVNNAGVSSLHDKELPFPKDADLMMDVNYYGTLNLCDAVFPLLKTGARVVYLSSTCATEVMKLSSVDRLNLLLLAKNVDDVKALMENFVESAKDGSYAEIGWPEDTTMKSYGVSKLGLNLITAIQQEELDRNRPKCDIVINACCPGFVSTEMNNFNGRLTTEEGADTPTYLAMLPSNIKEPKGQFLYDQKVYNWKNGEYPDVNEVLGPNGLNI